MTTIEAVILGLVQGVTEFLPISSTAHLRLVPAVAGWDDPGAAFTAVLQLGTLAAVIAFFLRDLLRMLRSALRALQRRDERPDTDARHLLYLIIGTIPIGIAGILLRHAVEGAFRSLWVVASALIVVALLLAWVERRRHDQPGRTLDAIDLRDAVLIGCAQALALVPGVSRSGATITAGLFLGFNREAAARYSFLLSVPAVVLSGLFEFRHIGEEGNTAGFAPTAIATVVAFVVGYATIAWLLRYVRNHDFTIFVAYRVIVGVIILTLAASGTIN